MDNTISEINNAIKLYLKTNNYDMDTMALDKNSKNNTPIDNLKKITEHVEKNFSKEEVAKEINTIYEIVKLNITFNQAGR
jgi:hypothetical protein